MASTDRPAPLTRGSLVDVFSPDRVRHVGRIVGVSAAAGVPSKATTVAILVGRVRESELRWNDARGRAVLAKSPTESLTMHFDTGAVWGPDENGNGRVRYPTVFKDSAGGSGVAAGMWANAEGWKWTRAKAQPVATVRKLKPVRETGPRAYEGELSDFGGLDDHDHDGGGV